jgi:hypothetical protein
MLARAAAFAYQKPGDQAPDLALVGTSILARRYRDGRWTFMILWLSAARRHAGR